MTIKISNNAVSTLTGDIAVGATSFTVNDATSFPTLGASDWTWVSMGSEVVKVTEISGDTFTCEATTEAHSTSDRVELRVTAELFNDAVLFAVPETSDTGSAQLPSGTTAQRDGTPAAGYLRYNTTDGGFEGYDGSSWGSVGGGATGGGSDAVFVENDQSVTTNYTLTAGKNASSVGPISIDSGVTVTVPSGARWVIL